MSELVNKNSNRSSRSLLSSLAAFQMWLCRHFYRVFQSCDGIGWSHLQTIDHRGNVA